MAKVITKPQAQNLTPAQLSTNSQADAFLLEEGETWEANKNYRIAGVLYKAPNSTGTLSSAGVADPTAQGFELLESVGSLYQAVPVLIPTQGQNIAVDLSTYPNQYEQKVTVASGVTVFTLSPSGDLGQIGTNDVISLGRWVITVTDETTLTVGSETFVIPAGETYTYYMQKQANQATAFGRSVSSSSGTSSNPPKLAIASQTVANGDAYSVKTNANFLFEDAFPVGGYITVFDMADRIKTGGIEIHLEGNASTLEVNGSTLNDPSPSGGFSIFQIAASSFTSDSTGLSFTVAKRAANDFVLSLIEPESTPAGSLLPNPATLAALKALDTSVYSQATHNGKIGFFKSGDFTGTADDVSVIKADDTALSSGAWIFSKVLYARDFDIYPDETLNQTSGITTLLDLAIPKNLPVVFDAGTYVIDSYVYLGIGDVDISCEDGIAEFVASATTTTSDRIFRFEVNNDLPGPFSVATNILPGQKNITLNSVTGITEGMLIRFKSTVLWPYDNRSVYFKGELHLIESVDSITNTITISDLTRDVYTATDIDSITIWQPNKLRLENLKIDGRINSTDKAAACIQTYGYTAPIFRNIECLNAISVGIWMLNEWQPLAENIVAKYISGGAGYGAQDRGCVGTVIRGIKAFGCRRLFDAQSQSGTSSAISRDYLVTDFEVHGGGDFFPNTADENYGIGNHGPAENGKYANGNIYDCEIGINHRGLNLILENINIYGKCRTPIDFTYGAGLEVDNVNYFPSDFPNKGAADLIAIDNTHLPEVFMRFGRASTAEADPDLSLPVIVNDSTVIGVKDALFWFEGNTNAHRNLQVSDMKVLPYVQAAVFYVVRHLNTFSRSRLSNIDIQGRLYEFCNTTFAQNDSLGTGWFVIIDGTHYIRLADDEVSYVGKFADTPSARPIIAISGDAGGRGIYEVRPANAVISQISNVSMSALEGNADGANMTGVTGTDGNLAIGVTAEGDVYLENRTGSNRTWRLKRVV